MVNGEIFSKKIFLCGDRFCGENLSGDCSTWGTNDQAKGKGVSQNVFSSNLNTVSLKNFF